MAVEFNIGHTSTRELVQQFPYLFRYAASVAINDVAFDARRRLNAHASKVFSNPRALTRNAAEVVSKSKIETLSAKVGLRDQVAKGNAPALYLRPQIYGGHRNQKRFEKALIRRFPAFGRGTFFVPATQNTEFLDSTGDLRGGVVTKMLSHLQAFGEQGYKGNIKNPKRALYFPVIHRGDYGMLAPGIYKRDAIGSENFKAVVYAVRKEPRYRKRFYYFETVEKAARMTFGPSFTRRFQRMAAKKVQEFNMSGQNIVRRTQVSSRRREAVASNQRVMNIRRSYGLSNSGRATSL